MRRVAIATTSTAVGVVALLSLKPHHAAAPGVAATPPQGVTTPVPTAPGGTAGSAGGSSGGSRGSSQGPSRTGGRSGTSGTFTGDAEDTRYGPVQVAATLTNGRLTAVKVLQVPDEGGREEMIVAEDVPQLTQEALAAGSAHIDAVSGATYTSGGYIQSLQSALDKARG